MRKARKIPWLLLVFSFPLPADTVDITFLDLFFSVPTGWTIQQRAQSGETRIASIGSASQSIVLFARPETGLTLNSFLTSDARITNPERTTSFGPLTWKRISSTKSASPPPDRGRGRGRGEPLAAASSVASFLAEFNGHSYYGFSRASSEAEASDAVDRLLQTVHVQLMGPDFSTPFLPVYLSLTEPDQIGKKYYLGWGSAMLQDPQMMQNEVKYDVQHTHDIFTQGFGGSYDSTTFIAREATGTAIRAYWDQLRPQIKPEDMYVQYSSGHGSPTGLEVGLSYRQIRDQLLALPAREIIVFLMSCHSGALVDAFNESRRQWSDWNSKGRTLMVLASSRASETSANGPGRDAAEPGGPSGSAGSAFGYALWKALSGEADGFSDGIRDGFISLGEIRDYTRSRTQQLGRHTPVETGTYFPHLIMNRVPSKDALATFGMGSDPLTEGELIEKIQSLDRSLGISPRR